MSTFSRRAKAEAAKYQHQIHPKHRHKYNFGSGCGVGSKGFEPGNTCASGKGKFNPEDKQNSTFEERVIHKEPRGNYEVFIRDTAEPSTQEQNEVVDRFVDVVGEDRFLISDKGVIFEGLSRNASKLLSQEIAKVIPNYAIDVMENNSDVYSKDGKKRTFGSGCGAGEQGSKGFQPGNTCGGDGDGKNDAGDQGGGDKAKGWNSEVATKQLESLHDSPDGRKYAALRDAYDKLDEAGEIDSVEDPIAEMWSYPGRFGSEEELKETFEDNMIDAIANLELEMALSGNIDLVEEATAAAEAQADAPAAGSTVYDQVKDFMDTNPTEDEIESFYINEILPQDKRSMNEILQEEDPRDYETRRQEIDSKEDSGEISAQDAAGLRDDLDAAMGMGGYAPPADSPFGPDDVLPRASEEEGLRLDQEEIDSLSSQELKNLGIEVDEADAGDQGGGDKVGKPASQVLSDGTHVIDHQAYMDYVSGLSDEELSYIRKDAMEAMRANPDGDKAGYYADEVNYVEMEMANRNKSSDAPAAADAEKPDYTKVMPLRNKVKEMYPDAEKHHIRQMEDVVRKYGDENGVILPEDHTNVRRDLKEKRGLGPRNEEGMSQKQATEMLNQWAEEHPAKEAPGGAPDYTKSRQLKSKVEEVVFNTDDHKAFLDAVKGRIDRRGVVKKQDRKNLINDLKRRLPYYGGNTEMVAEKYVDKWMEEHPAGR